MAVIVPAQHRRLLRDMFAASIEATNGAALLRRGGNVEGSHWHYGDRRQHFEFSLPAGAADGKLVVVGAGKAAASLAAGLEASLGSRIDDGCIIVKYGHALPLSRIRVIESGHPEPDQAGARGTQEMLSMVRNLSSRDSAFVLLTGGASALMVAPAPGLTLDDKTEVNRLLIRSGASINDINVVRKHLSVVKGGGLLAAANGARLCTLAISDVIGDSLSTIGSGPTVADPSTFQDALDVLSAHGLLQQVPARVLTRLHSGARGLVAETLKPGSALAARNWPFIVANLAQALSAMSAHARALGFSVEVRNEPMSGDTHAAARSVAEWIRSSLRGKAAGAPPLVLIAGGETTLQVHGPGRGGRNQEFALIMASELQGLPGVTVLSAGTDGTDGPTDVAGAFTDGSTLERARASGLDYGSILALNDSYTLFDVLGDHFRSGPTGTNVMDVCVAIVG